MNGRVWGPKFCTGQPKLMQLIIKVRIIKRVSIFSEDCLKNVLYTQSANSNLVGYFLSVNECQAMCQSNPGCHHFNYQLNNGQCSLENSPLGSYSHNIGYLSGPRVCSGSKKMSLHLNQNKKRTCLRTCYPDGTRQYFTPDEFKRKIDPDGDRKGNFLGINLLDS